MHNIIKKTDFNRLNFCLVVGLLAVLSHTKGLW